MKILCKKNDENNNNDNDDEMYDENNNENDNESDDYRLIEGINKITEIQTQILHTDSMPLPPQK